MDRGPDYLLYSILDRIVDDYFPIIDRLGERIDDVEDEIFINPTNKITEEMMALRTTIVLMRKALLPQRRIFQCQRAVLFCYQGRQQTVLSGRGRPSGYVSLTY